VAFDEKSFIEKKRKRSILAFGGKFLFEKSRKTGPLYNQFLIYNPFQSKGEL